MYVDYNEDGIIDEWDKQPLLRGNTPVMNYGLTLGGQWKGIDLNVTFQGAAMFNANLTDRPLQFGGAWDIFMDRWHKVDAEGNPAPFDSEGTGGRTLSVDSFARSSKLRTGIYIFL